MNPLTLTSLAQATRPAFDTASLPSYGDQLARMFITLGVFVAVLLALSLVLKKWLGRNALRGTKTAQGLVEIVHVQTLGPGVRLTLVRVAGRYMLIGTSGNQVTTLAAEPLDGDAIDRFLKRPVPGDTFATSLERSLSSDPGKR